MPSDRLSHERKDPEFSVSAVFSLAWDSFKRATAGPLLAYALGVLVLGVIVDRLSLGSVASNSDALGELVVGAANSFITMAPLRLFYGWCACGLIRLLIDNARSLPLDSGRFRTPAVVYLQVLVVYGTVASGSVLGLIFFIVPGLILFLRWSQAIFLLLDARALWFASMKKSARMTTGIRQRIGVVYSFGAIGLVVAVIPLLELAASSPDDLLGGGMDTIYTVWPLYSAVIQGFFQILTLFVLAAMYVLICRDSDENAPKPTMVSDEADRADLRSFTTNFT